jgi:hypothetical protein
MVERQRDERRHCLGGEQLVQCDVWTFDSKENTTTRHPAELDIAFAEAMGRPRG